MPGAGGASPFALEKEDRATRLPLAQTLTLTLAQLRRPTPLVQRGTVQFSMYETITLTVQVPKSNFVSKPLQCVLPQLLTKAVF